MDKMLTNSAIVMEDLEMDELVIIAIKGVILLGILNFLSLRSSSFLNLALLGSLGRTAKVL
jgi:hypothetical protein